ncbi:MAG TPA: class I SAM-dependent methyltransferase [Kineosporiaceae bacterium]
MTQSTIPTQTPPEHTCRGCGATRLVRVLDLGPQPGSDVFPRADDPTPDARWPLELWLCHACALVQLGAITPRLPAPPLAVESATSRAHARTSVAALLGEGPAAGARTVVEFASHHGGSWLGDLGAAGVRPAVDDEPADLVVDVHALAHEPDVDAALGRRAERLAAGGLLVLEFHHLLALVQGGQFDTVRHGHWSYLSLTAVARLGSRYGLRVVGAQVVPVFGGSLRVLLAHETSSREPAGSVAAVLAAEGAAGLADPGALGRLQGLARNTAAELRAWLEEQREAGRSVLGYGAPSKAPVLLGVSGVGPELLPFTVDAAAAKHGRRLPGCGIPIRSVEALRTARPELVLVLTWDIAQEVMGQLEDGGGWGARYVLPLPRPHAVGC